MKFFMAIFLVIITAISIFAGCGAPQQACPKIGDIAPDFTLPGLDGKSISLSSFARKPVIINTWSINCISCKKEMPYFQELYTKYSSSGLIVLMINTNDSISEAKSFLSDKGYNFPVIFDTKWEVRNKKYCRTGDPSTFLINSDGRITFISPGEITSKELLFNEVNKILLPQ